MREPHNNPATVAVKRSRKRLAEYLQRIVQRGSSSIFLGLVLLVEVGVGLVVIRDLRHSYLEVERIYGGSVRGLQRIGELQYDAQETRRGTLYALTTNDGNLQVKYADQSHDADHRVTGGIVDYLAQAQTSEEIRVGQGLADDWKAYLETRDEVLGLILESSIKEAIDLDLAVGVTRFERVHQDLEEIKRLYDQQASQRLNAVAGFYRGSTIKLTAALGFGLLFGSIAIWKIQQIRMRNALQLARLQMDFVNSVSHELRTPITAILSAAENVRDGLVREGEELREQATIITTHAGHLTDLVGQVLLYAATEQDKPWHQVRPLKVAEVVESALGDVAFLLKQNGYTVQQEVEAGLPMVDGDASVISQCLQNLIVNAVKYSGQSRLIQLSARLAPSANNASEVQISVRDFGIGIGDADLPHVFEPFYRSSRAVAARIRGTGLGLSIAKRGAEASGGRLTVVSKEGLGSVFTLHLPASLEVELEFEVEKAGLRRANHAREHSNH